MRLYKTDRTVLRLCGRADEFLLAYSSNVPSSSQNAFLDAKGRIVAAFDAARLGSGESLLVVERSVKDRLAGHLGKYLDLTESSLEETPYRVYHDLDGDYETDDDEFAIPQGAGKLVLTEQALRPDVDEEEYRRFRLEHRLPVQGTDYDDEMLLSVFGDERVSYSKGCYLGQEIVARVRYRAKPPRRLAVRDEAECPEPLRARMTSKAVFPDGRVRGFVLEENT